MTDEQVRLTFKHTHDFYQSNKRNPLFITIISFLLFADEDSKKPIMTDTYNLFVKYKDVCKDEDWCELCKEARELNKKYDDCDLASQILVELLNILEKRYTSKKK